MPTELPPFDPTRSRWPRHTRRDETDWNGLALSIPAVIVLLAAVLPGALVLPALSIMAVLAAIAMVAAGSLRLSSRILSSRMEKSRARDLAGILMLVAFGASMMTDTTEALRSIAEIEAAYRGTASAVR